MQLTTSSILNVTALSGIAVLLLYFLLRNQRFINQLTFGVLFGCMAMLFTRMVLPVEYRFATTIPNKTILPFIQSFLEFGIITIYGHNIQTIHILYAIWALGSIISAQKTFGELVTLKKLAQNGKPIETDLQDCLNLALTKYKKKKSFN